LRFIFINFCIINIYLLHLLLKNQQSMPPTNYSTCPINELTKIIVDEMYQTYFMYGPGLFERIYEATLEGRLRAKGLQVERQRQVRITNEYVQDEPAFYADLIVENRGGEEEMEEEKKN